MDFSEDEGPYFAQDAQNFVWMSCDQGLFRIEKGVPVRFDGFPDDTLRTGRIYSQGIATDSLGRIWSQLDGGGLLLVDVVQQKSRVLFPQLTFTNLASDRQYLYYGNDTGGLGRIDLHSLTMEQFQIQDFFPSTTKEHAYLRTIVPLDEEGNILYVGRNQTYVLNFDRGGVRTFLFEKSNCLNPENWTGQEVSVRRVTYLRDSTLAFGSWGGGISLLDWRTGKFSTYNIESNPEKRSTVNNVMDVLEMDNGNLLLGSRYRGLFLFNREQKTMGALTFGEGTLFNIRKPTKFSRLRDGSFLISETNRVYLDHPDSYAGKLEHYGGTPLNINVDSSGSLLLASNYQKPTWTHASPDGRIIKRVSPELWSYSENKRAANLYITSGGKMILMGVSGVYELEADGSANFVEMPAFKDFYNFRLPGQSGSYYYSHFLDSKDRLFLGANWQLGVGFYDFRSGESRQYTSTTDPATSGDNWMHQFFERPDGSIWYVCDTGFGRFAPDLSEITNLSLDSVRQKSPFALRGFKDLEWDAQRRLWAITFDGKLIRFAPDVLAGNSEPEFFRDLDELLQQNYPGENFDYIWNFQLDRNGNIWLHDRAHLYFINTDHWSIKRYGSAQGLRSFGVNMVEDTQRNILVPSGGGVVRINANRRLEPVTSPRPTTYFTRFKRLGQAASLTPNETLVIQPGENFLSFEFKTPWLYDRENLRTEYRLPKLNPQWTTIPDGRFDLTGLAAGRYQLEVRSYLVGHPPGPTETVHLRVRPPFYLRWWFLLGMALVIGIPTYLWLHNRTQRRREAELLQRRIAESEMAALQAQMNPHFLFNCLNSIKLFVLRNEGDKASAYLTKFSRLIRLILNHSREPLVPLSEELRLIQLYIEMERMRFNNKFELRIDADPDLIEGWRVPPMIIQPYIENAIWHGLMHLEDTGGKLEILLEPTHDAQHLRCVIRDNGIGRAAATELKRQSGAHRKSHGLRITRDRIQVAQQFFGVTIPVETLDLTHPDGSAAGTEVRIQLPRIG